MLIYMGLGLLFIFIISKIKKPSKTKQKKLEDHASFDYDLEQIEIDNFHISEEVDIHSKHDNEYGTPHKTFGQHTIVDRKTMTSFKTFLNFEVTYQNYSQTINVELPVDHTILRMKFYMQKTAKVYLIEEGNENTLPLLVMDFRFLEFNFFNSLQINFRDSFKESEVKSKL